MIRWTNWTDPDHTRSLNTVWWPVDFAQTDLPPHSHRRAMITRCPRPSLATPPHHGAQRIAARAPTRDQHPAWIWRSSHPRANGKPAPAHARSSNPHCPIAATAPRCAT